ncbi:hypothetical protein C3E98_003490 [Pseudomonas sp. MWU13-2625]|nr:hypothetical protein C3E98_003490 [Pseudomonas sp. MWU13-2625]
MVKVDPVPVWERACSRRGLHRRNHCCLTHRFREQARSHICHALFQCISQWQSRHVRSLQRPQIQTVPIFPRRGES